MITRGPIFLILLLVITGPSAAFARGGLLPGIESCTADLAPPVVVEYPEVSALDLTTLLMTAERHGLLIADDLRRAYLGGLRGRQRTEFVTYLTDVLQKILEVRALAEGRRPLTPAEVEYDRALTALRKRTLAFGERHPDQHAALTARWREATRELSLHLLKN